MIEIMMVVFMVLIAMIVFGPVYYRELFYKRWGVFGYGGGDDPGSLYGSFDTKEEAIKLRDKCRKEGFGMIYEVERCP